MGRASDPSAVPGRRVLEDAARDDRSSGAGLLGYLSEERGFMPRQPPLTALPPSHGAWDELAAALPALFRSVSFRESARDLPLLDAAPETLPDGAVRRAATVLGLLAHTWFRVETADPGPLPEALARPWAQVCARLGRPGPFLEFEDITSANWRLRDPGAPEPLRVENLDLLVPTVGNDAERFFMMTLVELSARATPLVGGVVRAQECMARHDPRGLEAELLVMLQTVRGLIDALGKADPNPCSSTHVDPVVWGSTVAPFAVSVDPAVPSPGGTAAPVFQLLDAFLGRRQYASVLGHEVRRLHAVAPPLLRWFVRAVAARPLGPYVVRADRASLRGVSRALLEAYAGEQGLLQLHRIKAYGYLEVAFKIGRPVTLSGFAGVFRERPWKRVDEALDASMREREVAGLDSWTSRATLVERVDATTGSGPGAAGVTAAVRRITLDVRSQGVVYEPGDRVAIVPENSPALVARVLDALRAPPGTEIELTSDWRAALTRRGVVAPPRRLDLADFLRVAGLRPLRRPVAKALYGISGAPDLGEVIEGRHEDQLELWDALRMMTAAGYDVRRLTSARPWQPESLAAIVAPEGERLYSISSAPVSAGCEDGIVLTVGDVTFRSRGVAGPSAVERQGVGSHWLNHHMDPGHDAIPLRVVRPRRFRLPADPSRPIVMFAGGTGISPFRGFLQARTGGAGPSGGVNVLFFAVRRIEELLYRDELDAWVRAGDLELHVAASRDERQVEADARRGLCVVARGPRRIQDLVDQEAARLWQLLGEGGAGVAYVCGRAGFAHAVMEGLRGVAAAQPAGDGDGRRHVRQLIGSGRLLLDVFTTTAPARAPGPLGERTVPASELVTRNDDEGGYWMAIDGAVYDVTEFRHLHPGGPHILVESAGTDATDEYRAVLHHLNGEVDAMLSMCKVGLLQRLRLGQAWGIAAATGRFLHVTVHDLYRAWVRYAYLVVEMQNAHRNDWTYRRLPLTRGEQEPITTQKLMFMANTHDRFVVQYLDGALGSDLVTLWRSTTGLCGTSVPIAELTDRIAEVRASDAAGAAAAVAASLRELYVVSRSVASASDDGRFWTAVADLWDDVRRAEERFLVRLKEILRQGLVLFERHEQAVVANAGVELVELLRSVPAIAGLHHAELVDVWFRSDVPTWCR
jgi:sulfite reductase (NADPH) flavoprotein alpha-component